ncbi:hypothetical protein [Myroides marinus]|uniref:hypothetical protein n=1 Tax=Myroides marinus TaxID=703342 RepID=UPI00257780D7|nr:hypothetical protein [Myroides marinus]MDM1361949.1 hypothetical protein [Myroides marinus]
MQRDTPFYMSLTKENSHKVKISAGQGRFSIGTKGVTTSKCDAMVDTGDQINWNVFNDFQVPAGGNWPRVMEYHGDDTSFIAWSATREMEAMQWTPLDTTKANFTAAHIGQLTITINKPIRIILGEKVKSVFFRGNISNLTLENYDHLEVLSFSFIPDINSTTPISLPLFTKTAHIKDINIVTKVKGQPFDCTSLLQFSNLTAVALSGNMCNLNSLESFTALEALELRYISDLSTLPALDTWTNLNYFIGWNIEEQTGKVLKKQLATLEKQRTFKYASVSNLKKPEWFITEFGIPFGVWPTKNNKLAVKAYKDALKAIKKASSIEDVQGAIKILVEVINNLPNIETTEREDTWEAVMQLVSFSTLEIEEETASKWFDQYRDF